MRFQVFKYLSVQLMLAAIVPILIVSSAISVPMITVRREQLLEQAQLRLFQAGRTVEVIYTERVAFAELFADLLADRPALLRSLQSGDVAALQDFVRQTRTDTLFDLVTLLDANGTVLAQDGMTDLWHPTQTFTDTATFWGLPGVGLVIQVTAEITNPDGPGGILVGSFVIDNAFLVDMRARTDMDQSIVFDDRLVATSLASRLTSGIDVLGSAEVTDQVIKAGQTAVFEVSIDGVPYLVRYKPLRSPENQTVGMIEVLLPLAPVRTAQNQATITLLVITLFAVLAALLLTWLLVRRFSSPVQRLAYVTEAIGSDGLAQPVAVQGPMEIQILSRAIEHMRGQLYDAYSALEAEKARYANILESVEEAIITIDTDECVTSLNRSAEALLGWNRTAARGLPLGQIVHLDQEQALALAQIPPVGTVQLPIRTCDGQLLTVSATRAQIAASVGDLSGEHIIVLRDISEEAALGRLKEDFLANITHEFRTPLAALTASLEILQEDGATLSPAERQHMLTTIYTGVKRLDTLVRNLLDSASLQAGYFRVDPVVSPLKPLIDEAIDTMRPLLNERAQTITIALPEVVPLVLADDRRIVQVLVNLLSNASKFGPRGDTLQLTVQVNPTEVCIGVTDHGPGIAPGRQPHLFQRFLRPGPETMRAQGIGLGLAIVKAIVERHSGQTTVSSSSARGTTFTFTLPRVPDPATQPMPD